MSKRFVVIVLDGFGIGAMNDVLKVRPTDVHSNTFKSILNDFPELSLPMLEKLGLMNAFGYESKNMKFSQNANYGKCALMHHGADTFMGHQEIMGTLPSVPNTIPFQEKVDEIALELKNTGHHVLIKENDGLRYLVVDQYCAVADNIDADLGMAYNCTAPLNNMSFEKEMEIAKIVRSVATVNRVISFGGTSSTMDDILAAEEIRKGEFIGIHAVKSKSYISGYECRHLGYGVDEKVQVPTILAHHQIPVTLIGKVADIVENSKGKSISCVETEHVMELTIESIKAMDKGFICTNVQETDLAGHSQDSMKYKNLLQIVDNKLGEVISLLNEDDILVIMADHGNDPNVGHNMHTRENVPLLIYKKGVTQKQVGLRNSLSDVGASVCAFFDVESPQNGSSFLEKLSNND